MAANLDRAETSLTAVSDIAYIRGIDGSGNSVRISKADLANVLGVIQGSHYSTSDTVDFNDLCPTGNKIKFDGCGAVDNKQHAPENGWGNLISISISSGQKSQIFINITDGIQVRHKDNAGEWSSWKKFVFKV